MSSKYDSMSLDDLVTESQAIGAQIDLMKEERRLIKQRIDTHLAALAAAPKTKTSVDATVGGVSLVAEARKE
jgi:hypothetical protein